jgi:hypothetical protein
MHINKDTQFFQDLISDYRSEMNTYSASADNKSKFTALVPMLADVIQKVGLNDDLPFNPSTKFSFRSGVEYNSSVSLKFYIH